MNIATLNIKVIVRLYFIINWCITMSWQWLFSELVNYNQLEINLDWTHSITVANQIIKNIAKDTNHSAGVPRISDRHWCSISEIHQLGQNRKREFREENYHIYSSSWLRRRALPLVNAMFNCAARSTIAFLFKVETLCAISALYFLHWHVNHFHKFNHRYISNVCATERRHKIWNVTNNLWYLKHLLNLTAI